MFIDQADIHVHGGRGGNGIISFVSNRHHMKGGTDGGSGGSGGAIILRAKAGMSTLYRFQSDSIFRGRPGSNGGNNNKKGAQGKDTIICVPIGTMVFDRKSGGQIADLLSAGDEVVVCVVEKEEGATRALPILLGRHHESANAEQKARAMPYVLN